jgi:hypothetical protein
MAKLAVLTGKVTVHTGSMTAHTGARDRPRHSRQNLYHKFRLRRPQRLLQKPNVMIKLEPNSITVRAVFAHLLSPEIIGNMLD